ncbi:DUF5684 domain-containing protein [Microbacterium marinum]|uniref:DUF5684 domain-containing protein n=1 Tax=Microbacterium marinum TaxID=421115 RepID=UPI00384D57E0
MNTGVDGAANAVLGLLSFLLVLGVYVWVALALSAMFRKMGEEPWRGWVPFLNIATVLKWGGFSPWLVLFALIPGAGQIAVMVLLVISAHRLGPGFGYGGGMTVLAAFLFPVWATILGFGPAPWRGARPAARPAPLPPTGASPPYAPFSASPSAGWSGAAGPAVPPPAWPAAAPATPPSTTGAVPLTPTAPVVRPNPAAPAQPASVAPQPWAPPPPDAPRAPAVHDQAPARPEADAAAASIVPDAAPPVSPAPFPPSSAAAARPFVSPPVSAADEGIISRVPGQTSAGQAPASQDAAAQAHAGQAETAPVTRLPAPFPPPAASDREEGDVFPELTGEVSAVVGSPAAGAPKSAISSVSAQQRGADERRAAAMEEAETELDDELDQTVIVPRRRGVWELLPPSGAPIPLESDVIILGRHPVIDSERPRAQLITVIDPTRTVSKTHARLERRGDVWFIVDLHSTNGVLLPSLLGTDIELEPGVEMEVEGRFLLGDASLRLQRVELGG